MITTLANTGVLLACARQRRRLLGIRDLGAVQEARLAAILRRNAASEAGWRHGFAQIRGYQDYRERVPTCTWDDLAGDVARIAGGEPGVLTCESVRLLEPSSGSTAATKLIPVTAGLQAEFRTAIAAWLADLYRTRPALLRGRSYWSVTPAVAARADLADTAIPVGFEDDAAYAGALRAALLRRVFAVDRSVAGATSMDGFYARTARALLAAGDLSLISVWNPTYLSLLLDQVAERAPTLAGELPPERRSAAAAAARGDWEAVWPGLRLVSCWADAHAAAPAEALSRLLPQAELQPKGLLATEGVVSIPITAAGGAVLAAHSHVVELLDTQDSRGPGDTDTRGSGTVCLPHEAQTGRRYQVLLTTSGGLYRYRLGDEVEVRGWHGALPVLRFAGRVDSVVDLVGEKLSEAFAGRCLEQAGARGFAVLAPEGDHYALYTDHDEPGLAQRVEAALRESFHYDHARRLSQLGPVRVVPVGPDAEQRWLEARRAGGQRLGDIKPSPLARKSLAFLA